MVIAMIRKLKKLEAKYLALRKMNVEYVDIFQVLTDLNTLIRDERIKRIPKDER